MATEQHVFKIKKVHFFIFFNDQSSSMQCSSELTQTFQAWMKTKASLTAMNAERDTFALPACIWLVF